MSIQRVLQHQTTMHVENKELVHEKSHQVAEHYVDKLINRLGRLMEGESIGSMIDSELENLSVDKNFERMR